MKKISIAIIGLVDSGKTSLVKRILQSNEILQTSVRNNISIELYNLDKLTLVTWDLINDIPQNDSLWKRAILGADALLFVIDSSRRDLLPINRRFLDSFITLYSPRRILVLAAKSDLPKSIEINELLIALDLEKLDKIKCNCDLFKFSSLTGEGLFTISEWLNKTLFNLKERIINYVEIFACILLNEDTGFANETIFIGNPNIIFLTVIRELKRKITIFSTSMRIHGSGEEIIDLGNFKLVFVKEKAYIIALLINYNNFIPRTVEIARNILKIIPSYGEQAFDLKKLVRDLYPLDIAKNE